MQQALDETSLTSGLALRHIGRRLVVLPSTASTNDEAWCFLGRPDGHGTVILADQQTAGRGRLGRVWHSPRGASILCSVLLTEPGNPDAGPLLGLASAIAARDAILAATGLICTIKWPNDVTVDGRKLAGILVESRQCGDRTQGFVVGVGINCLQHRNHFPDELRDRATSLEIECSQAISRRAVARHLLEELDRRLAPESLRDAEALRRAWKERAETMGRRIRVRHDGREFSGHVVDIDPLANLVVQLDVGGRRLFNAAETSVVADG